MKINITTFLTIVFCSFCTISTARAEAPVQIALFNPIQVVDEFHNIRGLRLNLIYGVNSNLSGAQVGLINIIGR